MADIKQLLDNNKKWAENMKRKDEKFFSRLVDQQSPKYLWIGCSDSRVPANEIVGLLPGEIFVHRNIANMVIHTDLNCLSVIQYAVDILKVEHIILCGHYDCAGINAALEEKEHGLIDNWLRHIDDIHRYYRNELDALTDVRAKRARLCELNIIEQVANICNTTVVNNAWRQGQRLSVHGWIYNVGDGIMHDMGVTVSDIAGAPGIAPRKRA
ncbi:MAG: carbonate dehydratase [Candidatus Omnitrophica bacterium]|nr:carbonate dehydratase [Candidatus Omnitrophota bacterium]